MQGLPLEQIGRGKIDQSILYIPPKWGKGAPQPPLHLLGSFVVAKMLHRKHQ